MHQTFSEARAPNTGITASGGQTNKTMTHEIITEEQVEDSAHNTKRQSIEVNQLAN